MPEAESSATVLMLERRAAREREARKRAEALLEEKSRELYLAKLAAERANHEKSAAELRYRGLFETAGDGVMLVDARTGQITDVNDALSAMLRLAPPQVVGQRLCELAPLAHVSAASTLVAKTRLGGQVRRDEWVLEIADGPAVTVEVSSHVYEVDGAEVVQCSLRDVTAERRQQQEAQALERASELLRRTAGVYLWRFNPDAGEYEIDPEFSHEVAGSFSERRVAAPFLQAAIHRDDVPALEGPFVRTLETGEGGGAEYRFRAPNGEWRRVRSAWSGARRVASGRWEVIGVTQDLTELMVERDRARAGEAAKSRFLANVSHELRTPMNGVLGVLHLLKTAAPGEDRAPLLDEALASGARLSDLLSDLVAFSDLETDSVVVQREPTRLADVLDAAVGPLRQRAEEKGLWLRVESGGDIPTLLLDAARVRQLLFSLVTNAVKFTSTGGVDVRVTTRGQGDSLRLRVEIEDTGQGIPTDLGDELFAEFAQADGSSTRRHGGVGLGLAIARRLAQLMDGEVDFASREGEGSTFWVEIAAPALSEPEHADEGEAGWLDGLRVLVVEDNATNRLVATHMLTELGAEVVTAEDGAQGVAAAAHGLFDLIFMDIQMPVMDGVEATRLIRALPAPVGTVPIIATTANVLGPQLRAYREAGMNGCVAKPIAPAALLSELARLAGGDPRDDAEAVRASA